MTDRFFSRVRQLQNSQDTRLCIGLDPLPERLPSRIKGDKRPIAAFNKAIIDATADLVCCYKPQIAHYASEAAEDELAETIAYAQDKGVPVLLDAKRGDVGSTAERYARELFERYDADAATVNPYLGHDALQPYLDYKDRGVFVLCRTSNPGGADLQHLRLESGQPLYERVAELASREWNANGNVGLVVGATEPDVVARVCAICPELMLLLPGVGAQGADVAKMTAAASGEGGMLVAASRAVLYAGGDDDFAAAARDAATAIRDEVKRHGA